MIVHQIFIPIVYKSIADNPVWVEAIQYNKSKGFKIKLWEKEEILYLIHKEYPQFSLFVKDFPNDFWLVDFARCLILHNYGGIYLDLDCKLIEQPNLSKNLSGYWDNPKTGRREPNNDFVYFKDRQLYIQYCWFCVERKRFNRMPSNWVCRRLLSIVGNKAMTAFKKKIQGVVIFHSYLRGTEASWLMLRH